MIQTKNCIKSYKNKKNSKKKQKSKKQNKSNYKHIKKGEVVILKNGVLAKRIKNGQFRFIKKSTFKKQTKKSNKIKGGGKKTIGTVCLSNNECNTNCCSEGVCVSSSVCKSKPKPQLHDDDLPPFHPFQRSMSLDSNFSHRQWGPCKYGNTCLRYRSEKGCRYDHPDTIEECLEMHDNYKKNCPPHNPGPGDILFFESGMIDKDGNKILCSEIDNKELKSEISNKYKNCSKLRNEWYNKCEQKTDKLKRKNHKITILSMARRAKECEI